jgi:hypothetical protein
MGHYACPGFINPASTKNSNKYMLVELTDNATSRILKSKTLNTILSSVFPHPLKLKKVWSMSRGGKSLFAWKAIPPDNFVALGMICTNTGIF